MTPGKLDITCSYCPKHLSPQSDCAPATCILSHGAPCLACTRQIKLATQIEETKKLLDKLIAEEHQARIDINNYHDPCHRLPVEIISHIFRLTLPEFALQSKLEYWPSSQDVPSEPWVLTLGAVCQRWRNIAWSTPQLWSTIMLSLHREPTDNKTDVFCQWLERSKPLPLSIRLYLSEGSGWSLRLDDNEWIKSGNMQFFLMFLKAESHRWKDLSLQCHQRHLDHLTEYAESAPRLQTLQLIPRYSHEERLCPEFIIGSKPQPDHVIALGYFELRDIGISWNNVTKVTVEELELAQCIRLLLISPKLINVRLQNIRRTRRHADILKFTPQTPRILPHIQTLYISSSLSVTAIFDSITLPSLERLSINGPEEGRCLGFTPNSLVAFLDRSSCALTSFTLEHCEGDNSDIVNFLYSLPPSVTKVELDIRQPDVDREDLDLFALFDHLSRRAQPPTSRSELFPNLKTFKYQMFKRSQFPWDRFPNLLRPVSGEPRPLKKITIIGRDCYEEPPPLLLALKEWQKLDKNTIRDLIKMMEDGVELFLPHKVSSEELLAILEK